MKTILLFFIIALSNINLLIAQTDKEPANYKFFVKQFVDDFNNEAYTHIALTGSASFLKSVPEKKLTPFLKDIRDTYGRIKQVSFKHFDAKGSAIYLAKLDKTWFNFYIGLNDSNQLKRLVVLDPNYNEALPLHNAKTKMQLPFDNVWTVFWGGDTEDDNYHVTVKSQKNAFDFVITNDLNKSFKTDGKTNQDYYAFSQKLYSPCNGKIIKVIDGVEENIPGKMNAEQLTGNTVIIKSSRSEYILMAHFKNHSIVVKEGDKIKSGQLLAECGNSGNTSEPHLHLHIMNAPDLKNGTGLKCYFTRLKVNGEIKMSYSPVRRDKIQRAN